MEQSLGRVKETTLSQQESCGTCFVTSRARADEEYEDMEGAIRNMPKKYALKIVYWLVANMALS